MRIRPYQESDEGAVIDLWHATLFDPAPQNDPATVIRKKREVEHDLFFVAEVDGIVVGTVMGGWDGHRGSIYAVAVRSDHRRRGIGRALLQRMEEALASRGCEKINLQVRASNAGVVGFYESLGYCVEDRVSLGKRLPS